jgi:hypothetical protein
MTVKKKYRIKVFDHTLVDFFVPLGEFSLINGTNIDYEVQIFKGLFIFGHWETLYKTHSKEDAYIYLMKEKYNIIIPTSFEWKWNRRYKFFERYSELTIYTIGDKYIAGYREPHFNKLKIYETSSFSYEDALLKLYQRAKSFSHKHRFIYKTLSKY